MASCCALCFVCDMGLYEKGYNRYKGPAVICPFWAGADMTKTIACEGLEDAQQIVVQHNRKEDHDEYMDKYCCWRYKSCAIHKMLMREKYGG